MLKLLFTLICLTVLILPVFLRAKIFFDEEKMVKKATAEKIERMRAKEKEARKILRVGPSASVHDIKEAHKKMIRRAHPDRGGSEELASQVNRARDVLLELEAVG